MATLQDVERMTDEAELAEIAKVGAVSPGVWPTETPSAVRQAAVLKLNDQSVLADVAIAAWDRQVCYEAAKRLTDQDLLVEVARKSKDSRARELAIEKLTDQGKLAEVATDPGGESRRFAVRKLTDLGLLAQIAKVDAWPTVRADAVEKITDPDVLAEIGRTDSHELVRERAVRNTNFTNQNALAEFAKSKAEAAAREIAVEKLTDAKTLAELARAGEPGSVRYAAVRNPNLTDMAVLAEVAQLDEDGGVRAQAAKRFPDAAILEHHVREIVAARVAAIEIEKIADPETLTQIALNRRELEGVRLVAIGRITNLERLIEIVATVRWGRCGPVLAQAAASRCGPRELMRIVRNASAEMEKPTDVVDHNVQARRRDAATYALKERILGPMRDRVEAMAGRRGVTTARARLAALEERFQRLTAPVSSERRMTVAEWKNERQARLVRYAGHANPGMAACETEYAELLPKDPRGRRNGLRELAVEVAETIHAKVQALYQSARGSVEYGSAGEAESWDVYSKGWHGQHGPARWKNAGVTIVGPDIVCESVRGVTVRVPLRPYLEASNKGALVLDRKALLDGDHYGVRRHGVVERFTFEKGAPRRTGYAVQYGDQWEHGATLGEIRQERQHKAEIQRIQEAEKFTNAKVQRAARLIGRVCNNLPVTYAHARAVGYCDRGIRAFCERYGFNPDAGARAADVRATGDASALRVIAMSANVTAKQVVEELHSIAAGRGRTREAAALGDAARQIGNQQLRPR